MNSRRRSTSRAATGFVSLFALAAFDKALANPEGDPPVVMSIPSGPYTVGNDYYSTNGWVEYHAGNLPIIITAPHGGGLTPSSIPDRTESACGGDFKTMSDMNTAQLARNLKYRFHEYTGRYPHVIINRLKRTKLDANRAKADGACGNSDANMAWEDFHDFIQVAKNQVLNGAWNKGWYIDVHGFGGSKTALGYRLSGANLRETNATLNSDPYYRDKSTFRTFAANSPFTFGSALLRGNKAIGTELGRAGYPSIPSKQDYAPEVGELYFQGGYNVFTHACRSGGDICGLQVEAPYAGVRDTFENRAAYAEALVRATDVFLGHNFEFSLWSSKGEIVVDNYNPANDSSKAVFEASSNWGTYNDNSGKYLSNFRRATGDGPENDWAAFKFKVPASGSYSVYARWPASASRSTSVRYRVFETIGGTMFFNGNRNQQINGGQWNLLGTWNWSAGGWGQVLISRSLSGPGQLAADAIRVVRN
jgi:hypothetical protein